MKRSPAARAPRSGRSDAARALRAVALALCLPLAAAPAPVRAAGAGGAAGSDGLEVAAGRELARLFSRRAPIEAGGDVGGNVSGNVSGNAGSDAALWRLELTAEVLAACRPDLSDLRILDAQGAVVPFAVDPGPPPRATATGLERRPARVLAARRREVPATGAAAARFEETFELEAPPPSAGGEWQLVMAASAPEFVREVSIEAVRQGERGPRVEGSLFRIRGLADQQLASPLPPPPYERLVVQLGGEELFPLRPSFSFEIARPLPEPRVIVVPLAAEARAEAGARRFVLARPAGVVPSALRVGSSLAAFERRLEVYDLARGRPPVRIGAASVFRMPLGKPAEQLDVELGPASGHALEVRLDEGDGPPLSDLAFSAVVRAPSLVFAPPANPERAVTLYFGGGRARAPRYQLERLLSEAAEAGRRGRPMKLGPVSENPEFAPTPPLAFAARPGAPVDQRLYSHQRPLEVAASSEGLVRVVLDVADVARMRPDLGDMRVVDAAGRQWPFLIDREPGSELVPLELGAARQRAGSSRLPLLLPTAPIAPRALLLDASDAYFDRDYHVTGETPEGNSVELARGRLQRDAAAPAEPVSIELTPARVTSLALEVGDADDSPIAWTSATARVDVPRLYLLAEPGQYRLLLGNALDAPPSYDVTRARDLILSVAFQDTPLGPLGPNPDYRTSARLVAGDGASRIALWAVLGLAVVALGGMTLRLSRREGG